MGSLSTEPGTPADADAADTAAGERPPRWEAAVASKIEAVVAGMGPQGRTSAGGALGLRPVVLPAGGLLAMTSMADTLKRTAFHAADIGSCRLLVLDSVVPRRKSDDAGVVDAEAGLATRQAPSAAPALRW